MEPFEGLATSSIKISSQKLQFCLGIFLIWSFLSVYKHYLLLLLSSGDSLTTTLGSKKEKYSNLTQISFLSVFLEKLLEKKRSLN